jgi:glycosyltransferase involved in cell wall biosynthesis
MGGGEKHLGAVAEVLAAEHQVDLLTHDAVQLDRLASHLGLDLSRATVRLVPDSPHFAAVVEVSRAYDLFINASHFDYFAPKAARNLLLVFFPATSIEQADALGQFNRAKRVVRTSLGPLLGETGRAKFRSLLFGHSGRSSDQTVLGRAALRLFGLVTQPRQQASILDAYDLILANSEFTRRWIRAYWQRESQVLYPPVDLDGLRPLAKQNWILGVGRFFAGSHNKKQAALIRAFRSARARPLRDWELHLAGGYQPTESNAEYLRTVQEAAGPDPAVHLHLNCSLSELRELYGRAKLFWHATGLDEDEAAHPERFEHFGISTVEAMAAGCVPLVIAKGGQTEIVQSGLNGIWWTSLAELMRESEALANDEGRRATLATAAVQRAREFGPSEFGRSVREIIGVPEAAGARD